MSELFQAEQLEEDELLRKQKSSTAARESGSASEESPVRLEDQVFDWGIEGQESDDDLYFQPEIGNVVFCRYDGCSSALQVAGDDFSSMYLLYHTLFVTAPSMGGALLSVSLPKWLLKSSSATLTHSVRPFGATFT